MTAAHPTLLRVGTLNLRNTSDRWPERVGLMIDQLVDLRPDVIGLQEVRRPSRQARVILREVNQRTSEQRQSFRMYHAWKTGLMRWWEGVAVLTDLPVVESESLDLQGGNRVAQRVRLRVGNDLLDFYNTHLHHIDDTDSLRLRQAQRIIDWIASQPGTPAVLVGDFNAQPDTAAIQLIQDNMRSAYFAHHNVEPGRTVPAPVSKRFGSAGAVIDFIFVNEHITVHDARITFDRTHPDDPRLSASDHFGLAATVSIREPNGL